MAHSDHRKHASPLTRDDWTRLLATVGETLPQSERDLLQQLSAGRSQLEIAAELGVHRSAIWRRAKRLAGQLQPSARDK
jgi:IS30 family transposase